MNPRVRALLFVVLLMAAALPKGLAAQTPADTASARMDSLAARLEKAEQSIELLTHRLEEQNQSKVQSRSRNHVEISGLILFNGWYNDARVNNTSNPQFVATPQDSSGLPNANLAAAVRQSRLGFSISGMRAAGANLSGDIQLDFAGGQQPSSGGRTFPLPRIRTAVVRLDWRHLGLLVGQDVQLISPLNPVSFAAVSTPEFTAAGNLWFWLPQVRLTYETGTKVRAGIQVAALAPVAGTPQPGFLDSADIAEKSRKPFVQGRVYVGWGDGDAESEIGFGVHHGWIATTGDTDLTSQAYSVDAKISLGEKIQLLGEGYFDGEATAGLGGGGIGQEFGLGGRPVKSRGGWGQLNLRPSFTWEIGGGAGFDDPDDAFLTPMQRGRNIIYEGHIHWRPGGGFIAGTTFRRIETTYAPGTISANHFNAFVGLAF
ncbi:MAG TPA: hypothetical protein VGI92_09660 [Gemmatimonadales bacterium]|jgi:hypothetical protein